MVTYDRPAWVDEVVKHRLGLGPKPRAVHSKPTAAELMAGYRRLNAPDPGPPDATESLLRRAAERQGANNLRASAAPPGDTEHLLQRAAERNTGNRGVHTSIPPGSMVAWNGRPIYDDETNLSDWEGSR